MAKKSPTQFHNHWGDVASTSQLPNVSGATIQDAAVEIGDTCYVTGDGLYVCDTATVGAGVWSSLGGALSINFDNVIIMSPNGNDANDGLTLDTAVKTYSQAKTLADALTPSSTNRVAIVAMPGVYNEQVTLNTDYLSLYGFGGSAAVEFYWDASGAILNWTSSNSSITGVTFRTAGSSTGGTYGMTTGTGCFSTDCTFVSYSAGERRTNNSGEHRYYHCRFEQPSGATALMIYSSGVMELYNCYVEGVTRIAGGTFKAVGTRMSGSSSSVGTIQTQAGNLILDGCDITGTVHHAVEANDGAIINNCNLTVGSSSDCGIYGYGGSVRTANVSGTTMNYGMCGIRLLNAVHRVCVNGGRDYHKSLSIAVSNHGTTKGVVVIEDDLAFTGAISIAASADITIDGRGRSFTLDRGGNADLFTLATSGSLRLDKVKIDQGNIDVSGIGAHLEIDGCFMDGQVDISGGDSTTVVEIIGSDIFPTTASLAAVRVGDVDPTLRVYGTSHLRGGSGAPAIELNSADNPNLYLQQSTFIHGDGGANVPISNPTASTAIHSNRNGYNADPFTGNWNQSETTSGDVIDSALDDYGSSRG